MIMRKNQSANPCSTPESMRRSDGRSASQSWAALVCMSVLAWIVILAAAQAAQAGYWRDAGT